MRAISHGTLGLLLVLGCHMAAWGAECRTPISPDSRTLVIALDGVPIRVIQAAQRQGAFSNWSPATPLISTFPSLTNVAFTAFFQPLGAARADGYEVKYFDKTKNGLVGRSPFRYKRRLFAWRDSFDVTGKTVGGKIAAYTRPKKNIFKALKQIARLTLESPKPIIFGHVGATDALLHLRGDVRLTEVLVMLDRELTTLQRDHLEQRGVPLEIVLLSDHGNTKAKTHSVKGIRKSLRRAGLRPTKRLRRAHDVVSATFGMVSYGALFVHPGNEETAATAVATVPGVELAAWRSGDAELTVVSRAGRARVLWKGQAQRRSYSYRTVHGDPLGLHTATDRLERQQALDAAGFASAQQWRDVSALARFPAAPARLVDAFTGRYVSNTASVLFSLAPGFTWGLRSARASSRFAGGRLEGTHGGLDRDSSLGFFMTSNPKERVGPLQIDQLIGWIGAPQLGGCVSSEPDRLGLPTGSSWVQTLGHIARIDVRTSAGRSGGEIPLPQERKKREGRLGVVAATWATRRSRNVARPTNAPNASAHLD